jgi:hypothetical protein
LALDRVIGYRTGVAVYTLLVFEYENEYGAWFMKKA